MYQAKMKSAKNQVWWGWSKNQSCSEWNETLFGWEFLMSDEICKIGKNSHMATSKAATVLTHIHKKGHHSEQISQTKIYQVLKKVTKW